MTKFLLLLFPFLVWGNQIKIEHAMIKPLGKMIQTNAQITQLSDQKQEIVSRLSGHVEAYYVQAGQMVKKGDKVVLIESIALAKLTADYLALKQQIKPALGQANTTRKLYKKGLASKNQLSTHLITLETLRSQKNALSSQLQTLDIDADKLTKATDKFILYAHADGVVGKILVSLHSNVDAQSTLMTLVQQSGYYAIAFLSLNDAMKVTKETKAWVHIADKNYPTHFVQLLPNIDRKTQRAKVLFAIENNPLNLLLGTFTEIDISLAPTQDIIVIKKSALTLFKGEWVVFVKKEHEEEAHHDEKSDHNDDKEKVKHEEHEEVPYEARVIEVIAYVGNDVAIKGLKVEEEYVSNGVYFVKSMILKSSLGEHGH